MLYFSLELYQPCIAYLDSSFLVLKKQHADFDESSAFLGLRSVYVNQKALTYGRIWEADKSESKYVDLAMIYCKELTGILITFVNTDPWLSG